jgi:hypothetical protein
MTLAEINRQIESYNRVYKLEQQEIATHNYILADLIGRSISRVYSSANHMPEIYEAYPTLFDSKETEEKRAEQKAELSALRFKQFAQAYNKKYKEAAKLNE